MPIKTLQNQRRLAEIGRLRMGRQVTSRNGKPRPERLAEWRLTSAHQGLLEYAKNNYGGQITPWEGAPTEHPQYELFTEAAALNVLIPPGQLVSQWMESWSGGGCQRRCDGEREYLGDQACLCRQETPLPQDYRCKPTTRLNVILRDVPAVGVWRLEIHGYYGAVELAGMAQLLEDAGLSGRVVPAELRIEQRSIKRPGQPVKRFAVPVLAPESDFIELVVSEQRAALNTGRLELEPPDYDTDTGEIYDDSDRLDGEMAPPVQPVGASVPTLQQIQRLRNVEEAKRLVKRSGIDFPLHVEAAIRGLDSRLPKLFWEQETEIRVWRDVLEHAVELHEQRQHETADPAAPPPAVGSAPTSEEGNLAEGEAAGEPSSDSPTPTTESGHHG